MGFGRLRPLMKCVRPVWRNGCADWQSYDDRVCEAPEQDVDGQDGVKTRQLQDDRGEEREKAEAEDGKADKRMQYQAEVYFRCRATTND